MDFDANHHWVRRVVTLDSIQKIRKRSNRASRNHNNNNKFGIGTRKFLDRRSAIACGVNTNEEKHWLNERIKWFQGRVVGRKTGGATVADIKPNTTTRDYVPTKPYVFTLRSTPTNQTEHITNDDDGGDDDDTDNSFCEFGLKKKLDKAKLDLEQHTTIRYNRQQYDPFENAVKKFSGFRNRAALKMAELDYKLSIFDSFNEASCRRLVYVNLCYAPGGFEEYISFRVNYENECKPWLVEVVHGYGITLHESTVRPATIKNEGRFSFTPFQQGGDNTGNVYSNIESFSAFVRAEEPNGVNIVLADGGFSVAKFENQQERLSWQLYFSQFAIALRVLGTGGVFVCKLFDTFSIFSIGLIFAMKKCFKQWTIMKPSSSRPANSERYIVFKSFYGPRDAVVEAVGRLFDSTAAEFKKINALSLREEELIRLFRAQIFSVESIRADKLFSQQIVRMNNTLGKRQLRFLKTLDSYCRGEITVNRAENCQKNVATTVRMWLKNI